jgi:hypothetical protein
MRRTTTEDGTEIHYKAPFQGSSLGPTADTEAPCPELFAAASKLIAMSRLVRTAAADEVTAWAGMRSRYARRPHSGSPRDFKPRHINSSRAGCPTEG